MKSFILLMSSKLRFCCHVTAWKRKFSLQILKESKSELAYPLRYFPSLIFVTIKMSKKEKEAFVDHLCLLLKSQFSNKYSEINLSAHLNRSVNSVYLEERR